MAVISGYLMKSLALIENLSREAFMLTSPVCTIILRLGDVILHDEFEYLDMKAQLSKFPKSITLCQTVAVWKHIAQYQKNQKKS